MRRKSVRQTRNVNWVKYAVQIRRLKKGLSASAQKSKTFLIKTGIYTTGGRLSVDLIVVVQQMGKSALKLPHTQHLQAFLCVSHIGNLCNSLYLIKYFIIK